MPPIDTLLQRFGLRPGDIAGSWFASEIPVSEAFINRQIAARLERHPHIASVLVTLQEGDAAVVRVEPRSRLVPAVAVNVRIEQQPSLPEDPVIVLRWSMPAAGPLALIAGKVAGYIKGLPDGVRIESDLIVVDLRTLLRARGVEDVLTIARRVAFHTRPGALVVELEAGIS